MTQYTRASKFSTRTPVQFLDGISGPKASIICSPHFSSHYHNLYSGIAPSGNYQSNFTNTAVSLQNQRKGRVMRQSDCTIEKPIYLVDWAVLFNRGSRREKTRFHHSTPASGNSINPPPTYSRLPRVHKTH